jgi:hypothetical protein
MYSGVLVTVLALTLLAAVPGLSAARAEALNPWTETTSYPVSDYLSCVTSGGYVYCLSTEYSSATYYAAVSSSGVSAWTATTPYPTSIAGESCVTSGGYIYCVSGINGSLGPRPTQSVYYAPLSSSGIGAWSRTTNYPVGMIALSCTASGGYAYCVGGSETVGTLESNLVYYAPLSSSGVGAWAQTTNYPVTVADESCAASGSYIYCVGGWTALGPREVNATYSAPLSSGGVGSWSPGPVYPLGGQSNDTTLSCSTMAAYLYCVGGDSSSVYYANLPPSGAIGPWTSTANYPIHVASPSCIVAASTLTCIAGNAAQVYYTSAMPGDSRLTISTKDTNGNPISGYYTVVNESGSIAATGFTTATFTLTDGQGYTVQVDNYGSCHFDHWQDTGSKTFWRSVSITGDTQYTAVMNCGGGSQSSVTVQSTDQNGKTISGYYTALFQNGNEVDTGFTPATFSTTSGLTYSVQVSNYGSCSFVKWSDGVATDPRAFTASSGTTSFTAVYSCGSSSTSTIQVSTVNSMGTAITGYYITLWQSGAQIASCFSACSFTVNGGLTYQVEASSYGSESFSHWQNDGATGRETVNVPTMTTTISLTAVYSP